MTNRFEHFLEPVLQVPETAHALIEHGVGQELLFTGLSIVIAFAGIFLAYRFYVVNPQIPERVADRFRRLYTLINQKYRVDEIYDALFVNRAKDLGNAFYFFDSHFVDGAVNGTAATTRGTATVSRIFDKHVVDGLVNLVGWINMTLNSFATALQTGMVQRYAFVTVFGIVIFILIYYNRLFTF